MRTHPTVLLINPNTNAVTTAMMARLLQEALPAHIRVESATAASGVPMITTEPEMAQAIDEVIRIGRQRAAAGKEADMADVDAIIIGAFGNPGLQQLRSVVDVPVIGIGEASMREAAQNGRRFGVATTTPGLDAAIARQAAEFGLAAAFTGVRVPSGDPLVLAGNPLLQEECLAELVLACIADGAGAVVIGGGPLAEAAAHLGARFDIPVISAVAAAARAVQSILAADTSDIAAIR